MKRTFVLAPLFENALKGRKKPDEILSGIEGEVLKNPRRRIMKKKMSVEDALIQSLKDAHEFEVGKKKLTTRTRELPPPAPEFTGKKIKKLRAVFGATQNEFATIMNVKVATVRSWEQGQRKPADASNRLLELMEKQGPQFLNLLKGA